MSEDRLDVEVDTMHTAEQAEPVGVLVTFRTPTGADAYSVNLPPELAADLRDQLDRALDPRPRDLAGILARLSDDLGELGVAVGELRADYGPWPDEEVRPALSLSEPAGGAIRAAWVLLREAAERAPAGYPGPNA